MALCCTARLTAALDVGNLEVLQAVLWCHLDDEGLISLSVHERHSFGQAGGCQKAQYVVGIGPQERHAPDCYREALMATTDPQPQLPNPAPAAYPVR